MRAEFARENSQSEPIPCICTRQPWDDWCATDGRAVSPYKAVTDVYASKTFLGFNPKTYILLLISPSDGSGGTTIEALVIVSSARRGEPPTYDCFGEISVEIHELSSRA